MPQTDGRTDRQMQSDAYDPTVQIAQVGSKSYIYNKFTCLKADTINSFIIWITTLHTIKDIPVQEYVELSGFTH